MLKKTDKEFLISSVTFEGKFKSINEFLFWIHKRREAVKVEIELISFSKMTKWCFNSELGNLQHESGKFFSIDGIEVNTNWGNVPKWTQP